MKPDFLIVGLPRSRTAWLSNWLTYGKSFCFHEPLLGCDSLAAFQQKFDVPYEVVGAADTGAIFWLEQILMLAPDTKLIIVERPVEDCIQSLDATGIPYDEALVYQAAKLLERARQYDNMWVPFHSLDADHVGASIWHHCVGDGFDVNRFRMLRDLRVEIMESKFAEKIKQGIGAFKELMAHA